MGKFGKRMTGAKCHNSRTDRFTLYRLTNETLSTTAPTGTLGYGYDPVGNRTSRASSLSGLTNQTFTFNPNDWLTNDTYDSNGNTTGSAGKTYQYDALNRLTGATNGSATILLGYDGDGHRVKKSVGGTTTYYLVDDRNPSGYAQVLEEWTASGGAPSLSRVYNYGLNLVSQRQMPGGTVSYYGYDGHGSVRFLTGTTGTVTDTYMYDAFGTLIAASNSTPNNYLYAGEQWDPDLGLYFLRARYYQPRTGRFWSMDSFEGNNEDPLSLHKYLYGADDPVNRVDPSGQDGTVMELSISGNLAAGLAAFSMAAVYEAKTHALSTLTRAVAIESISMGDSVIETARSAIRAAGKSLRDLIEEAKTQIGQLRNSPVKVIPMPRSIIPGVAAHIASAQSPPTTKPMLLERCSPGQAVLNRAAAIKGIPSAGPGYSLDEYPFASSIQGGAGASVAAVPFWENCVQGGIIGACYKIEKITPGTPYYVVVTP
jgi:RHS repeat-associated protein